MNQNSLINFFKRATAPIKRRVQLMVGRAVIAASKDDQKIQTLQVQILKDEVQEGIQNFQHFGFRSNAPRGSEAIIVAVGGNRENSVCIATVNRDSKADLPNLQEGESVAFSKGGTLVHFKLNGEVFVKADTKVEVEAPSATFSGDVEIAGNLKVGGNSDIGGNSTVIGVITGGVIVSQGTITAAAAVVSASVASSGPIVGATVAAGPVLLTAVATDITAIKSSFNSHTHVASSSGGPTTPPSPQI